MSSSTSTGPTLALFGATGGCCRSVLRRSLDAGLRVNVLARTPSKLSAEFPTSKYPTLAVIQGDIRDTKAVKESLTVTDGESRKLVDIVVSGVGMVSGISDPTLCEDGMKCLLTSITELQAATKGTGPRIVAISSTGISTAGRDIPLLMVPLYRLFIGTPHADKRKMEQTLRESGARWCIVRPSLLQDGESKGLKQVRVGVEIPKEGGKAEVFQKEIGYRIRREDVGLWIFEELVKSSGKGNWEGKMVSLTY